VGPDGNIWFTDVDGNQIWSFDLNSGVFTRFDVPTPNAFPTDITTGTDGNLWFVEQAASKIARMTVEGEITELDEPVDLPSHITTGPDGNIWFTEAVSQRIGKITPGDQFTFYPTDLHTLGKITPGFGQALLFTSFGDNKVAEITTEGVITSTRAIPDSQPTGITRGPGFSVWFLGFGSNRVYRYLR
jgi:streptogramin lyase